MTNDDQHIPSGYKPSPLGIIPEDWEMKRLGELGSFKNGLNFTPNEDGFSYYFLGVGDFQDKTDIHANELNQIRLANELDKDYHLKDDDLVFVRSNGSKSLVGRCVIIHTDHVKATYSGFCIRFRTISEETSTRYIKHIIDAGYLQRFLQYEGRGTNITNLNQEILGRLTFPLPNLKEQQNILNVLSLWGTAIAKQTALIEQLTLRKRGLMQQLLTGKKRLKGFEGEWKRVKFKEIFQRKTQTVDGGSSIQVLSVTKEGIVSQKEYFIKEIASDDTSKYLLVEKGDLAMSGLNFWMGSCHILIQYEKGIISPAYKVFSIRNGFSIEYIVNFVKGHNFKSSLLGSSVIGASIVRRNLDLEMLEEWTYLLPSLPEQQAISNILTRVDKEIEIQKQKLAALQEQKKGLMQVLLTGKKRIQK